MSCVIVIAYDLETTGLNAIKDRVVQFAIKVVSIRRNDVLLDIPPESYTSLVNPGSRRMHPMAMKITGITDKKVENAPSFRHIWKTFMNMIRSLVPNGISEEATRLCMIGHNSRIYDDIMLVNELRKINFVIPDPFGNFVVVFGDTLVASRNRVKEHPECFRGNHRLSTLYHEATGMELSGAHDALVDTNAVEALINYDPICQKIAFESWSCRLQQYSDRLSKIKKKAKQQMRGLDKYNNNKKTSIKYKNITPRCENQFKKKNIHNMFCSGCNVIYSPYFVHICKKAFFTNQTVP